MSVRDGLLGAAAVTSYVVGLTYYGVVLAADETAVFGSPVFLPADMINLLFYPLMLGRLGCDQAQGYFMSRPVPAAELDHWLSARPAVDQPADIRKPLPA